MVCSLGTPKRHPKSGIYWFRKRVPERLRPSVGKSEIKFWLRTRDPAVARIRNLKEMLRIERAWAQFDPSIVDADGLAVAYLECKAAPGATIAGRNPFADRNPRTVVDRSGCRRRAAEGHDDPRAIARADIVGWRDALLRGGMTPSAGFSETRLWSNANCSVALIAAR